jgi:hypothetical protein
MRGNEMQCDVIMELGNGYEPPDWPAPDYNVLETVTIYNYFCLKMGCFQAFFGRDKGIMKNCPNCGMNDEVVAKFG